MYAIRSYYGEGNLIEIQRPASGLVTALEPVMRACSGTWIAHGAGSADREAVDQYDRVMVPPEKPTYRIRRVWLSKEEEQGYYYGRITSYNVCYTKLLRRRAAWSPRSSR